MSSLSNFFLLNAGTDVDRRLNAIPRGTTPPAPSPTPPPAQQCTATKHLGNQMYPLDGTNQLVCVHCMPPGAKSGGQPISGR